MFEVRFHGRGGQGAVMAAQTLAEAAVLEGYHAQAFPYFGAERRGAPVKDGWWGYDTLIVEDPDGNELFFPYPKEEGKSN